MANYGLGQAPYRMGQPPISRLPQVGQGLVGALGQLKQRQDMERKKQAIGQIMRKHTDPKTGQPNFQAAFQEVYAIDPQTAYKLQELGVQQAGGKTQGPAAQIEIDDQGRAWQLSREMGKPVMTPVDVPEGYKEPSFTKKATEFTDSQGNRMIRPWGSTIAYPVTTKEGTTPVQDPDVLKGKAETAIKWKELEIDEKTFDMAVQDFHKKKVDNLVKYETFKMKNANRMDEMERLAGLAYKLSKNPNIKYVTGLGRLGEFVPGTPAADAGTDLEGLVSQSAIQSMEKLKSESPTGATGFGSMQANELKIIIDNFATLSNRKQSPEKMVSTLKEIHQRMQRWMERQRNFEKRIGYIRKSKDLGGKYGF